MTIERFEVPGLAQYSYMISSQGEAAVIDPIRDIDPYLACAARHGLRITHILETHIHADFASGSTALAAATGGQLALSAFDEGELYRYAMPHRRLRDGDTVSVGSLLLKALHTPGHTPEHLSFLLLDEAAAAAALFSGDFLFFGSVGRPDLLGESARDGLARELHRSLVHRIAALPDSLALHPGHGAGSFCGAGLGDRDASTLGDERATNPLFRLTEDQFVRHILGSLPALPAYYPRMKQLNSMGAPIYGDLPGGQPLTASEVHALAAQGDTLLLDLRTAEAFAEGHIPAAINIGAGPSLSLWAGWLLDANRQIVLLTDGGDEEPSRRALLRVGLDHIIGYLAGGLPAWLAAGYGLARTRHVSPFELQAADALIPDLLILDVRNADEWATGHIAGAMHIPLGDLPSAAATLAASPLAASSSSPTRRIVTACAGGYRASAAASLLERAGLPQVASLAGGLAAWTDAGLPLTTDKAPNRPHAGPPPV